MTPIPSVEVELLTPTVERESARATSGVQPLSPSSNTNLSVPSKAKRSFWVTEAADPAVKACPYFPEHRWWEFRVGDVVEDWPRPDELLAICRGCYVVRCGEVEGDPDPCMRPRHHREFHKARSGLVYPVGGDL